MNKLAVFFPGIGYTVDKPLMYYSRKIASELGYEIKLVPYSGFPKKIIGSRDRKEESYQIALRQTREMLSEADLAAYEELLFVGKSIGTIVAAQMASDPSLTDRTRLIFYTPLEETFGFECGEAIVFTGSADPWVGGKDSRIPALSARRGYPCFLISEANHSLETGDVQRDLENLQMIMKETERFTRRA